MTFTSTIPPRARGIPYRVEASILGLVRRHGRWKIIRAALFARPNGQPDVSALSDAIRRDMGLPHEAPKTPPSNHQALW